MFMATSPSSAAAAGGPIRLGEAYNATLNIRVYGDELSDRISLDEVVDPAQVRAGSKMAMIRAFAMGNYCKKLPVPMPIVVWGPSVKPDPNDRCADPTDPNEQVWTLPATAETAYLDIRTGTLGDMLTEIETKGIDGGLQIENPRFEDGKLCATVHAWAKIKIFGKEVGFDERVNVCIPLQGCYPVWSIDIAKIEACFRAPSELCIQLCVGKWGLTKCWDACAHIPIGQSYGSTTAHQQSCACRSGAAHATG
jgi:hypothetical protein